MLAPPKYAAIPASAEVPLKRFRGSLSPDLQDDGQPRSRALTRHNERRSRVTFAFLVALTFIICSVGGAVIGSAVTGYVMAGLFKAAGFNMST